MNKSSIDKESNKKCVYCGEPASFTVTNAATKLHYCDKCYFGGKAPRPSIDTKDYLDGEQAVTNLTPKQTKGLGDTPSKDLDDGLDDWVERINLAVHYKGPYDHEDVRSILKNYAAKVVTSATRLEQITPAQATPNTPTALSSIDTNTISGQKTRAVVELSSIESILLQYRAELKHGLNELAGHDPLEQATHSLGAHIAEHYVPKAEVDYPKVDRFEVIDETGRAYVKGSIYGSPVSVEVSLQDDDRTMKVFVKQLNNHKEQS